MKPCSYCAFPLPENAYYCKRCRTYIGGRASNGVNKELGWPATIGIFTLLVAVPALIYFVVFFDTSVSSEYGRVHNIGLMQDRMVGMFVSAFTIVGAVLLIVFGLKARSKR